MAIKPTQRLDASRFLLLPVMESAQVKRPRNHMLRQAFSIHMTAPPRKRQKEQQRLRYRKSAEHSKPPYQCHIITPPSRRASSAACSGFTHATPRVGPEIDTYACTSTYKDAQMRHANRLGRAVDK